MRFLKRLAITSIAALFFAGLTSAQQKPAKVEARVPSVPQKPKPAGQVIPLKVKFVISEYEGKKKIDALPYTLGLDAVSAGDSYLVATRLRMIDHLPSFPQITKRISCSARALTNGRYQLQYSIQRNTASPTESNRPRAATTRYFSVHSTVVLRDGHGEEPILATDPASKYMLHVSITLHVEKHS